ncbi:MAG TPA: hypothetical protein P5550_08930, partial [Bacteroidales bacterium]|nr:hypothetical protein [Bacteroidales bacterium]
TALPDQSIFEGHILQLCEGGGDMDPGTAAVPSRTRGRSGSHSCLLISDLLQLHGQDLRSEPLTYRLEMLVLTMQALPGLREMALAELLPLTSWDALASLAGRTTGRPRGGAFLKEAAGVYDQPGARPWMVVEAEPLRSRLILRYVALGPRGPGGLEELSLGAASPSGFVTVCKLKPSLPAAELHDLMAVIKASATERFGPVRVMPPEQVFEIEYQGVKSSARHKSGLVLLEPSLLRWCRGESADQADSMNDLRRSAQG